MMLLAKKTAGLALTLLGGLAMVHGAAAGRAWETWTGLVVLAAGVALLAIKVVRRNAPTAEQVRH
jgi:hypothetical protein